MFHTHFSYSVYGINLISTHISANKILPPPPPFFNVNWFSNLNILCWFYVFKTATTSIKGNSSQDIQKFTFLLSVQLDV